MVIILKKLLTEDVIDLNLDCKGWEDAIKIGAKRLLERGDIEERYIEAVLEGIEKYGPYMVIAPGIVLSHARPEDGVNNLCMSLVTLKNEINFGNTTNDPVRLIFTFGAVDNTSHLEALVELTDLLMNKEDINKITNSTSKEEVLEIIKNYSV